jgi:hypothetical protein
MSHRLEPSRQSHLHGGSGMDVRQTSDEPLLQPPEHCNRTIRIRSESPAQRESFLFLSKMMGSNLIGTSLGYRSAAAKPPIRFSGAV